MSRVADQNLLFGILALQMDFLEKDVLLAAMNTWMMRKEQSLGAILLEQGVLDRAHHELLTALVHAHVKQHGDDPEKSLAAVSSLGSVRADLEKMADPALQASLVHVPRNRTDDAVATMRPPTVGVSTSSGQRFRILRPHAKGGLGQVYVALDEELQREVALKEIQQPHSDNLESRARFLLEAQITGGLEHPGIVPVYGLGQYADGRPYYAMRFIRGESLLDAIRAHHEGRGERGDPTPGRATDWKSLELRRLLGRFVDVCQALQYAHDRGILHRDLKPGNIMLGKYGETLVVDWGLAKAVGKPESGVRSDEPTLKPKTASGSAETLPGAAMGTPQFMSPEQAAGKLEQLGPCSDVYSLGATLYNLLTGKSPFEGADIGEMLRRVQKGDFPRPRSVKADVPPALEAICLRAMALESGARYAAPRLLAQDIENWLGDEPVSAYVEPWSQRLMRWARRHRVLVEVVGLSLAAAAVVSVVISVWMRQQANQEREARLVSEHLREDGLRVAAQFAARTLAYEMDLRWWILKGAADDAELRRHVNSLGAAKDVLSHADWKSLQAWLQDRFRESSRTKAASWFVTDRVGRNLARHPPVERLVGKSFAFRDYFHGLGRDLEEGAVQDPIKDVHRSMVFESQSTGERMLAFSVPIWSGQNGASACLGVLGMTIELGEFAGLRIEERPADDASHVRFAVLVDARGDWLEDKEGKGLILHHPWLEDLRHQPQGKGAAKVPILRVEPLQLARLQALRQARLRGELPEPTADLDRAYRDPAGGEYAGTWLAAFAPVMIDGRPDQIRDTGWAVIVQER